MAKVKKDSKSPKNFIKALDALEEERGISKETVLDALKEALEKSYKRNYLGPESIVNAVIDDKTGKIELYETKYVVDDVMDEDYQLSEEEAQEIDPKYHVGDTVVTEVSPDVFGRLAAIQTKQILRQKIREAEKEALYNEYVGKKNDIITGIVDRVEERFAIINIGKTGALLPLNAQIPGEKLHEGQHLKVYVSDVERGTKGTHIAVSRTDPGLVKRLFELEVPEIFDGTVEIKSVSREAGERSKIAVYTDNPDIDPIGACVGPKGTRVRSVVDELNGEMIDIIEWDEDPVKFISNALSPAEVSKVVLHKTPNSNSALVVVPDNQLSLAIGKRGQNARLAVRLTNWKIDIKSETEVKEENIDLTPTDETLPNESVNDNPENEVLEDEAITDESFDDESFDDETFDDELNDESFDDDNQNETEEAADESSENEEPETTEKKPQESSDDQKLDIDIEAMREANEDKDTDYVKIIREDDEDDDTDEEPEYYPKYDEDIDYDEYDKYYD